MFPYIYIFVALGLACTLFIDNTLDFSDNAWVVLEDSGTLAFLIELPVILFPIVLFGAGIWMQYRYSTRLEWKEEQETELYKIKNEIEKEERKKSQAEIDAVNDLIKDNKSDETAYDGNSYYYQPESYNTSRNSADYAHCDYSDRDEEDEDCVSDYDADYKIMGYESEEDYEFDNFVFDKMMYDHFHED